MSVQWWCVAHGCDSRVCAAAGRGCRPERRAIDPVPPPSPSIPDPSDERRLTLQRRLFEGERTAHWDPALANTFAEECAHLHEEVSETFRAWRLYGDFLVRCEDGAKPEGVPVELADVAIGLFYLAELHGFDLLAAIEQKHAYNLGRDYVAEGRQLHAAARPTSLPEAPEPDECMKCGAPRTDDNGRCPERGTFTGDLHMWATPSAPPVAGAEVDDHAR